MATAQDSCKITYISKERFLIEDLGAFVKQFKEVNNVTIFEKRMDFIYYDTRR